MASFSSFLSKAISTISGIANALGGNAECMFVLKCNRDSVQFPVTPGSYEVETSGNNGTVNINALGTVNMIGKRGLNSIKFQSFFPNPDNQYSFSKDWGTSPYDYVDRIISMKNSGQPARLVISGTNVSTPVTIEEFAYSEKDGSGDVYFSIGLREYRYILQESNLINATTGLKERTTEGMQEKSVTAVSGMDAMEMAAKSVQKIGNAVNQGVRKYNIYKALIKSGGVSPGTVLRITASEISRDGKVFKV